MSGLRRGSAQGRGELIAPPERTGGTRYEFGCPRCAGTASGLEDAGAVVCPFCGSAFFSRPGRESGWTLPPRLTPTEGFAAAKRWLRETGRRVRNFELPSGVLLPVYWARGRFLVWELADASRPAEPAEPEDPAGPRPAADELWEPRFSQDAYGHTFPAHPLASLVPGRHTRLESATLRLLDPDLLPAGFRLLEPTVTLAQAEVMRAEWLDRRSSKSRRTSASLRASERIQLVAFPLILVPYDDPEGERQVAAVDAVSGAGLGLVPESWRQERDKHAVGDGTPVRIRRAPSLVPLECANCGTSLAPGEHDRLYGCGNCGFVWELSGVRPRAIRQWALEGGSTQHWLPFWIFGKGGGRDAPPLDPVFVPAYGGRHAEAQLHLAARLTRRPPAGSWSPVFHEIRHGAKVGSREAREWRWALEGILSRRTLRTFLEFVRTPAEPASRAPAGLLWIPFDAEGRDLVEPRTGARTLRDGTLPWSIERPAA